MDQAAGFLRLLDGVDASSLLVVGAVSTYVLGFLFRDQIYIRTLVAIGSILYILYYLTAQPAPLWDAIIGSSLIVIASAQGAILLYWSRLPTSVPSALRDIHEKLPGLEPGLFRRLMRLGHIEKIETPTILVFEGRKPAALWFVVEGSVLVERTRHAAVQVHAPRFIGEIAWMLDNTASATVVALPGTKLVRWEADRLKQATRRSHRLELALQAVMARDISKKLATSRPIDGQDIGLTPPAPVLLQASLPSG